MEDTSGVVGPSPLSLTELETPKVVQRPPSLLKQPKTFVSHMNLEAKKENIPPEDEEFPVIKRKAEEVVAERPTKVVKKEDKKEIKREDLLARKKVPVVASKVLKEKDVSLNAKVNQFSSSLRGSTAGSRLNQSMRVSSSSSASNILNHSFRQPAAPAAKKPALKRESSLNVSTMSAKTAPGKRPGWDVKGRLEDMELLLRECMSQNTRLDSQVHELHEKVGEKDQKLTAVTMTNQSLKGTLDNRQGEVSDLINKNREMVLALEQIRADMGRQLEQETEKHRVTEFQLETTKGQLAICRAEADSLRLTVASQTGQVSALECQVGEFKTKYQVAEQLSTDRAARITELEQIIREREETIRQLEEKSREDENLRRNLHNQIQELKGNIRVFCRVRPGGGQGEEDPAFVFPPNTDNRALEIACNTGASVTGKAGTSKKMNFNFDKVFQPGSSQAVVFHEISQLVQSVLDGYNTCIFTYGQTGSGKTYTMEGPPRTTENSIFGVLNDEHRGMIPRTVEQIFQSAKSLESKGWKYEMEASFLEIYNETIRDLLSKKSDDKLDIKHEGNNVSVAGLSSFKVTEPSKVYDLLAIAGGNRAVGKTNCNERSSRSHSVFQLKLKGVNTFTEEKVSGILNLIDLAGSERLSQSGATGDRLKETQNINKSLSSLADVICALANKDQHIPYRNSKLTHLLMNSLGGNSKTLMFVNISPEGKDFNETLSSLRFATKVNACEIGVAKKQQKIDFNK